MSDIMRNAVLKTAQEWARLDEFLKAFEQHHGTQAQKPDLEYRKILVPTTTHGIFELDYQDVLKALTARRDALQTELQQHTATGQSIKPLPLSGLAGATQ